MSTRKRRSLGHAVVAWSVLAGWMTGSGRAFVPASPEISGNIAILTDTSPSMVKLGLTLTNTGTGAARRIEISAAGFRILSGSGTVSVETKLPVTFGDLGAGSSSGQMPLSVTWPDTAVRVQMIAEYTAGSYHSRQTFNLYR